MQATVRIVTVYGADHGPMLIRQTLLYLPAQVLGPLAQFAAILVFTHLMAPEGYGLFTYVLASQDFVFLLSLSWWSQYTVRYLGDHSARADAAYRDSETVIVVATIALQALASILILRVVLDRITLGMGAATILYTVSRCLVLHLGERARARHLVFDYTLAQAAGPVCGLVVAAPVVALLGRTPEVALAGYGLVQAAILVWLAARQDIAFALRRPDRDLVRRALAFGLPLIAAGLAAWFSMNAIRILVDQRLGSGAMGLIAVGWALGHRLMTMTAMLVTVAAFPLAVESLRGGSRERAYRQITSNGVVMLGLMLPAAVGLYLVQAPLIDRIVAAPFRAMTLAVLPAALAAGLFRNIRTHVADQVFVLCERTGVVLAMGAAETVLVVAGCAIGLVAAGPAGAAMGAAVGYGIAMVASFATARVVAGLRVPLLGASLVTLAVAIMAATVRHIPGLDAVPGGAVARIGLVAVVGAAAYAVAILALFPAISRRLWSGWRRPGNSAPSSAQPPRSWKKS